MRWDSPAWQNWGEREHFLIQNKKEPSKKQSPSNTKWVVKRDSEILVLMVFQQMMSDYLIPRGMQSVTK